ncbi:MAG TPA: filamentous hemagglutinin family protein [Hydrogenophaga sp.]|uniref:filamentous haemagglutinin family protein n=1 Tax=Hydrogenophaga sp. TaxID=1904254 RepID=UPI002D125C68|nr:filamentous haemagglutinin family protein [Hydrogenophaga sp.]HSX95626.1 filamentous hemagglutinin family protein [Hydrogenophaga sp.]
MNSQRYRLVFSRHLGTLVAVAECARAQGKAASGARGAVALAGALLLAAPAWAQKLPVPSAGGGIPNFVTAGQATYQAMGHQAFVNQVGNKAILNWQSFNVGAGHSVQFRQVHDLNNNQLVQGANFTTLNRIWDINPSVIAGAISQADGQKANIIMVNTNGIAFLGGSQVNLNSFTASSLNIADRFITESFVPGDNVAQFQGDTGFIKVFPGAQISAGNFGRVMLLAPTVVNRGTVTAPDGQIVAAAASKVYLTSADASSDVRGLLVEIDTPAAANGLDVANTSVKDGVLDGQAVALINAADDKLGAVSNFGTLSTPRGNVTMIGLSVNQSGIAHATTSVVANGSIYLTAADRAIDANGTRLAAGAQRGGRVTLGAGSLTTVEPEKDSKVTSTDNPGKGGSGLDRRSVIDVIGQDIRMAGGAAIVARSGEVSMTALDAPGSLNSGSSIYNGGAPASSTARVHIADGARIDVSGLDDVEVDVGRNSVEVELRGDELKDSPINRNGPLRGQKAYLDVTRALANAAAGLPTLIAQDSLQAYAARLERTVAERSTTGGSIQIHSQGQAIVESGAVLDVSGGKVTHTPGIVRTTLLHSRGKLTDLADARADVAYGGIANRYVVNHERWNKQDNIELPTSYRYDPGYVEGKAAGGVSVFGMKATVMQGQVIGRTTTGTLQAAAGARPAGATLTLGYDDTLANRNVAELALRTRDFKLNQSVVIGQGPGGLSGDFGFGDELPEEQAETLHLDSDLLGDGKVANLRVFSNQAIEVRDALRATTGGSVQLTGSSIDVRADITARGGAVDLLARNTAGTVPASVGDPIPDPQLRVRDGVRIDTSGVFANARRGVAGDRQAQARIDGGSIRLRAESQANGTELASRGEVLLGQGARLDASAGAAVRADGSLAQGDGGAIEIAGHTVQGLAGDTAQAYGAEQGGSLTLGSHHIQVGGEAPATAGTLHVDPALLSRGGFQSIELAALGRVEVAAGTTVAPRLQNRVLDPSATTRPSGSSLADMSIVQTLANEQRQAVDLTLSAGQGELGVGTVVLGAGSRIEADPGATVTMEARDAILIDGTVRAQGGRIVATLDRSSGQVNTPTNVNPIFIGSQAELDVSGTFVPYTDASGSRLARRFDGGTIELNAQTGYVITQQGSTLNVSGAAPRTLDLPTASGGLGRTLGTDAGTVRIHAEEGAILDGRLLAKGGSDSDRAGTFEFTLSEYVQQPTGSPPQPPITLRLDQQVGPQAGGLTPGSAVPNGDSTRATLSAQALEDAGFDRIRLSSRDGITLGDGLQLGAGRERPLREVTLDAARIRTGDGDARLAAETVRLGNHDAARVAAAGTASTAGSLRVDAGQIEVAGKLQLEGMASAQLNARESIVLAGLSNGTARPVGELSSTGDLSLQASVVSPSTYSDFTINAPGRTVRFEAGEQPASQPLSAQGRLTVKARDIEQAGTVWAPLGQIDLQATGALTLENGSLTSVAAAPGSVIPFGKLLNGRDWVYDVDSGNVPGGQLAIDELEGKAIRTSGATVDQRQGARVDLSGGGDLQAYEVTVGPGGSSDILAAPDTYAILPGYQGGTAPLDAQEGQSFDRAAGEAVYLSGVPGLPDGVYTLLPAHYALLPGAYAVKLGAQAGAVVPGQGHTRQDGIRVAAGYLTDTRGQATRSSEWQGIQVLSGEQVRERTEFTLARAAAFFDAGARPQDAGLLSVAASQAGAQSIQLNAQVLNRAASGGRGAALDIAAPELVIVGARHETSSTGATAVAAERLNELGFQSLLIGGTRTEGADGDAVQTRAERVTVAHSGAHALKAGEVMLSARDTLSLEDGSRIEAQGASGDRGTVRVDGNGAFLRAASTTARFERTGAPDGSTGTLQGAPVVAAAPGVQAKAGAVVTASSSVVLDATRDNAFEGDVAFERDGAAVAGNLTVGASRFHFGAAPDGATGITYGQDDLDAFSGLASLTLSSYSSFDFHGNVHVGQKDAAGQAMLGSLTLQGGGLNGAGAAGDQATLRADTLTLSNPSKATASAASGEGRLRIEATRLNLGNGDMVVDGFTGVDVRADEVVALAGTGRFSANAPLNVATARVGGAAGSQLTLQSQGAMQLTHIEPSKALANATALGGRVALEATSVHFDTTATLPSGRFSASARSGDVTLGANARVDVAGRSVALLDATQVTHAGEVVLNAQAGHVDVQAGARIDLSAPAGGNGGSLQLTAAAGTVSLASGSVVAGTRAAGDVAPQGASVQIDAGAVDNFSALNAVLEAAGAHGARAVRARTGDLTVAQGDTVRAGAIALVADAGKVEVNGHLDASGEKAGTIDVHAGQNLNVGGTAVIEARASAAGEEGGRVLIGSRDGQIAVASGSRIDVAGGQGGAGGTLQLRARRTGGGAGSGVAVSELAGTVANASAINIEAVKVYQGHTLQATGTGNGSTVSLSDINADNTAFAASHGTIQSDLNLTGDARVHVLSGVEVRSTGDLTVGSDINLNPSKAGGEAGVLTLRANGSVNVNNHLSDGFSQAAPTIGAQLQSSPSWSYRIVAGADAGAADPLQVRQGAEADVTVAAGKVVRTGTGHIDVRAARDIKLASNTSVIYTAGRVADALPGFVAPPSTLQPTFAQDGGDVSLRAGNNIDAQASTQLFSDWLFRVGSGNAGTGNYNQAPAWWVRFDQFRQGVGALGGGDVQVHAGGSIKNLSVSVPTQGRVLGAHPGTAAATVTGGGDITVTAAGDVLGGSWLAGKGQLDVRAGGTIGVGDRGLAPVVALGDALARLEAGGDVVIENIVNPQLLPQSALNLTTIPFPVNRPMRSAFSTYGNDSGVTARSLGGDVRVVEAMETLQNAFAALFTGNEWTNDARKDLVYLLPPRLAAIALQGSVAFGTNTRNVTLAPSSQGQLELLAADSVTINSMVSLSDQAASAIPTVLRPANAFLTSTSPLDLRPVVFNPDRPTVHDHASTPVHGANATPALIIARDGDVAGYYNAAQQDLYGGVSSSKPLLVKAGRDVKDLTVLIQHSDAAQTSRVEAGRDVAYSGNQRRDLSRIAIGGPGALEVTAGRDLSLGTSRGISSRGNLDNANLPEAGADLRLSAGVGAQGLNLERAVERLLAALQSGSVDDSTLWQARWLTGKPSLDAADALEAVRTVAAADVAQQRRQVREMLFAALRQTGRDRNDPDSPYAGSYDRGYAALELVFPGIGDAEQTLYQGGIDMFASRVKTERGGNIDVMVPGGGLVVGLANTPQALLDVGSDVLGMVVAGSGDLRGFTRDDILVNQSRMLTLGAGDVMLWSSEGDIDAGRGKKTASAVPPPVVSTDGQGNVTLVLQGAVSGSGIGALKNAAGLAGDVDLIAPKGTVNAGDAGIRAGNLNIAAQVVLGADNISVSGTSTGTPVADTSAVTAASSGATSGGNDASSVVESLNQAAAESAKAAQELASSLRPSVVRVEVLGYGE